MSTILQVTEKNNWEHRTYFAGQFQLTPEATTEVYVSWPNGAQERFDVQWQHETVAYSDHGITGYGKSYVPYITASLNGMPVKINLKQLEILV